MAAYPRCRMGHCSCCFLYCGLLGRILAVKRLLWSIQLVLCVNFAHGLPRVKLVACWDILWTERKRKEGAGNGMKEKGNSERSVIHDLLRRIITKAGVPLAALMSREVKYSNIYWNWILKREFTNVLWEPQFDSTRLQEERRDRVLRAESSLGISILYTPFSVCFLRVCCTLKQFSDGTFQMISLTDCQCASLNTSARNGVAWITQKHLTTLARCSLVDFCLATYQHTMILFLDLGPCSVIGMCAECSMLSADGCRHSDELPNSSCDVCSDSRQWDHLRSNIWRREGKVFVILASSSFCAGDTHQILQSLTH